MKRRRLTCFLISLFSLLLLGGGLASFWLGIPKLSERYFGDCSSALKASQCRLYGSRILIHKADLLFPRNDDPVEVQFKIDLQESISSIANRLQTQGLIPEAGAFTDYLIYKGLDSQVKSGIYLLSSTFTPVQIAEEIRSNKSVVSFFIYPGWRAEEIAAALPTSGVEVDPSEFLRFVRNPSLLPEDSIVSGFSSAEGFLFPGDYEISRQISASDLVLLFVQRSADILTPELIRGFEQNGLDLYQGVILASIIQRETYQVEERPSIASVFYNRLAAGMKLETDPTVQYALGRSKKWEGWWKSPLRIGDLDVDSPYNTYLYNGLPPTPISNPDLTALQAVSNPDETPYFFFRSTCDGSGFHQFSVTFEEHSSKNCK